MTNTKALTIGIIFLLVLNLALMVMMFMRNSHDKPLSRPKEKVIQILEFNDDQIASYNTLITSHQESIREIEKQIFEKKSELYALLKTDGRPSIQDSLFRDISLLQLEIERTHLDHFRDIKSICNADQKENFNNLADEIQKIFTATKKKTAKQKAIKR